MNKTLHAGLLADIESIENDEHLYFEPNFCQRQHAIDYLDVHIMDRIDSLPAETGTADTFRTLWQYAASVKQSLEAVDSAMFCRLRKEMARGQHRGHLLMELIAAYLGDRLGADSDPDVLAYDNLDVFINGLLTSGGTPVETLVREAEMVYYQKTPARVVLQLVRAAVLGQGDVFFDLGSGLGQVVILVNLLAGVPARGIEFEPAFCSYAGACAAGLHLHNVDFINIDARNADYSQGTVFFMYTPFEGQMLSDVLRRLYEQAQRRSIKLFTYGPCTRQVAQQEWLTPVRGEGDFGEFVNFQADPDCGFKKAE